MANPLEQAPNFFSIVLQNASLGLAPRSMYCNKKFQQSSQEMKSNEQLNSCNCHPTFSDVTVVLVTALLVVVTQTVDEAADAASLTAAAAA